MLAKLNYMQLSGPCYVCFTTEVAGLRLFKGEFKEYMS